MKVKALNIMQGQEKKLVKPFKKETAPTTGAAYISAINGLIELKFTISPTII